MSNRIIEKQKALCIVLSLVHAGLLLWGVSMVTASTDWALGPWIMVSLNCLFIGFNWGRWMELNRLD